MGTDLVGVKVKAHVVDCRYARKRHRVHAVVAVTRRVRARLVLLAEETLVACANHGVAVD